MKSVVDKFYEEDPFNEKTFDTLFVLQDASVEGIEVAKATYTNSVCTSVSEILQRGFAVLQVLGKPFSIVRCNWNGLRAKGE